MSFLEKYTILAVIIAGVASMTVLIVDRWRRSLLAFALQYLAVFWLCSLSLSIGLASIKLITGLVAAITLASTSGQPTAQKAVDNQPGRIFRLVASLMVWIVVFSLEPKVAAIIPGDANIRLGGMILIGMGLFQLGVTTHYGRVMMGLLTTLAGFDILYSALESSVLVTGLLAVMTLGLAFAGAFLLSSAESAEPE